MEPYIPPITHADAIPKVRGRIVEALDPDEIWLFGSAARGEIDRHSDLDMLVVMDFPESEGHRQSVRLRRAVRGVSIPMDLIPIMRKRFQEDRQMYGTLAQLVVDKGQQIYAKDLTEYAVRPWYPGTGASVSAEDAQHAIIGARHVKEKIQESYYG